MQTTLPRLTHVLELCLYSKHLPSSVAFYRDVLQLTPHLDTERMAGFALGHTNLLIFQRGATHKDVNLPDNRGLIPRHGLLETSPQEAKASPVQLRTHFCLAVENEQDVQKWADALRSKGVTILGEAQWPQRGQHRARSVYFQDPDGHIGEVASPGIWPNY